MWLDRSLPGAVRVTGVLNRAVDPDTGALRPDRALEEIVRISLRLLQSRMARLINRERQHQPRLRMRAARLHTKELAVAEHL